VIPREPGLSESGNHLLSQIPNVLSAARFVLAAIWIAIAIGSYGSPVVFLAIAIVAATTDFVDGRIARRLGVASGSGRWLDAIADVTFVLAALVCEAWAGAIPFYIPILIAISFSQYAFDSILIAKSTSGPIKSRLGHWGGIINYGLVIALAASRPHGKIATILKAAAPAIASFYLAAIAERASLLYRRRTSR
jgi:phosphatidylglycerophosphate synthase